MAFTTLEVPSIRGGSSLLRSYALEEIRKYSEILVFHYECDPRHDDDDELDMLPANTGKVSKLVNGYDELYDNSDPAKIKHSYLPTAVPYDFTPCLLGLLIGN